MQKTDKRTYQRAQTHDPDKPWEFVVGFLVGIALLYLISGFFGGM